MAQEITALVRHSSLQKSEVLDLEKRGINIVAADLDGSEDALAKLLQGVDIVIAAVNVAGLSAQIPLANAAKAAGVKRFVPCFFATIAPPKGIMSLRDMVSGSPDASLTGAINTNGSKERGCVKPYQENLPTLHGH